MKGVVFVVEVEDVGYDDVGFLEADVDVRVLMVGILWVFIWLWGGLAVEGEILTGR